VLMRSVRAEGLTQNHTPTEMEQTQKNPTQVAVFLLLPDRHKIPHRHGINPDGPVGPENSQICAVITVSYKKITLATNRGYCIYRWWPYH
ncbi:hypothetical protein ACVGWV_00430, partial [Enterobacter asburiae]